MKGLYHRPRRRPKQRGGGEQIQKIPEVNIRKKKASN